MARPVLYLIACAAGPARYVDQGVRRAQERGWDVCAVLTPSAARWWDARLPELEELTGRTVRSRYKLPHEADALPKADAMVVAPLTTTSACKWAAGITDTVALGLPAEVPKQGDDAGFGWGRLLDALHEAADVRQGPR